MTEIAKVDASAAVIMSVNNSLVCAGMEKYCNEEQKMKYLVPLAYSIAEPSNLCRSPFIHQDLEPLESFTAGPFVLCRLPSIHHSFVPFGCSTAGASKQ